MGGANLSKSLVQFSVDGQGCVLSLLFGLRSNYDRDHYCYNSDLLQKDLNACIVEYIVVFGAPVPVAGHYQLTPLPETSGHSQASLGQSFVGCLLLSPGSWWTQSFVCALQESVSPVLWKFCNLGDYGKVL